MAPGQWHSYRSHLVSFRLFRVPLSPVPPTNNTIPSEPRTKRHIVHHHIPFSSTNFSIAGHPLFWLWRCCTIMYCAQCAGLIKFQCLACFVGSEWMARLSWPTILVCFPFRWNCYDDSLTLTRIVKIHRKSFPLYFLLILENRPHRLRTFCHFLYIIWCGWHDRNDPLGGAKQKWWGKSRNGKVKCAEMSRESGARIFMAKQATGRHKARDVI